MKLKLKKAIWLIYAFGWWGVLYPEFTLTEDTFRVVWVNGEKREEWDEKSATEIYCELLQAEPKQIKIKSKLWEILMDFLEKE